MKQRPKLYTVRKEEEYPEVSFDFLGHQFKPSKGRERNGKQFLCYGPQIGKRAFKSITRELRKMCIHRKTGKPLSKISKELNPKLQGWINYFGKYGGAKFKHILHQLNIRLYKWVRWRYKLRGMTRKIIEKMKRFYEKNPNQFAHWRFGIRPMKIT